MKKLDILHCDFAFKCPLTWDNLVETANRDVRYCATCVQHVFLCKSQDDLDYHRFQLHCVAFRQPVRTDEEDDESREWTMGQEEVVPEYRGPVMSLVMTPTYSLSSEQLSLLQRSFGLEGTPHELRLRYCQGTDLILQKHLVPKQANSIAGTLKKYGIGCRLIPERTNKG